MQVNDIFNIEHRGQFEAKALTIFRFQAKNNAVYKQFIELLGIDLAEIKTLEQIPFLPIAFFKQHKVLSCQEPVEAIFKSSGTTATSPSQHFVTDLKLYKDSFLMAFNLFFGPVREYTILALLPSYLERGDSSLVYMVKELIAKTEKEASGFYLHDHKALNQHLLRLEKAGEKTLLIGVSYALLDHIEKYKYQLKHCTVMETGGMKGRRIELIREELHAQLKKGFGLKQIASEYGMTELLSQAYALKDGSFSCPPWMQVLIRDPEDPFSILADGRTGGLNIIDLANINSCAFIATQDLAKKHENGSFEILGRFDHSDIRGCNLMVKW